MWFNEHKDNDRSMEMEVKFLKRAIDGCMSCMVRVVCELKTTKQLPTDAPMLFKPWQLK